MSRGGSAISRKWTSKSKKFSAQDIPEDLVIPMVRPEVRPEALFDVNTARSVIEKRLEYCGGLIAKLGATGKMRLLREFVEALVPSVDLLIEAVKAYLFVQRHGWMRALDAQFQEDEEKQKALVKALVLFDEEEFFRTELERSLENPRSMIDARLNLQDGFQDAIISRFDAWALKLRHLLGCEADLLDPLQRNLIAESGFKLLAACRNDRRPLFKLISEELSEEELIEYMLSMQYCARRSEPSVRQGVMPMLIRSLTAEQLAMAGACGFEENMDEWKKVPSATKLDVPATAV